mmetsp:Transcript_7980/g.16010  ORF Transcript_7980/g.16010 Transcript_7980/m.16010 type:complete len:348 (+) Transcript_7980:53-1096(+)|eukprot:CAMPEP_0119056546 /NCGR_PEP_ID=MMETSP1178-20130426/1181_1 /TAXON_ID=33656 /ORGANISM="unid sp, Strain CCMP2000" /LENGTH=347 /DNA_ID=CAMNT_0007037283 /DNA_START=53 /DNA_END=1096 /DNA_ORIENTATION=+
MWAPLSLVQERVLDELFLHTLSEVDAAVVLVNPLRRTAFATWHAPELCGSVVFVSSGWQQLTGFRAEDVIGRNDCNFAAHGFAAQGPRTEPAVLTAIAEAIGAGRACKALLQSYAADERPFWNMLSLSPVVYKGELIFYLANLQDYTAHVSVLTSPPRTFCRSSAFHQRRVPLTPPALQHGGADRMFATPSVIEADEDALLTGDGLEQPSTPLTTGRLHPLIRRLGWSGLTLEPEHLAERVSEGLRDMGGDVSVEVTSTEEAESFVVDALLGGGDLSATGGASRLAVRVLICDDSPDALGVGRYRIMCSRLAGDSADFHACYRQLAEFIGAKDFGAYPMPRMRLLSE